LPFWRFEADGYCEGMESEKETAVGTRKKKNVYEQAE
jgi:hypothetical protein